ncbi:FFLEELY motif protein [Alkalimarinus alittae]|uniref:DUF8198 domain-containing protein n=1 Tax=Alkalimarinus alittae TaxID=2961619 RepID=A0ABY6N3S2_9ALTE|nr:hypothetical protein [Alkalimarinus alittae]UZE96770.1 hypothetical protein NKI27_03190 [Alkalimarinus alittae]
MSKEKLIHTKVKSDNAERLRQLLLDYHNFRYRDDLSLDPYMAKLSQWQADRLKVTHQDLYQAPRYHEGLTFLLKDLYAPKEFTQRDDDLERIFPVAVKLLPDNLIYTIGLLVELNLLTQQLDMALADVLFNQLKVSDISEASYCEAYRLCNNKSQRLHQTQLIANIGNDLDVYVRSRLVRFTLKMTRSPAEMAGLGNLHSFLRRGFSAFQEMNGVDELLTVIISRESAILESIYNNENTPFSNPTSEAVHQASTLVNSRQAS